MYLILKLSISGRQSSCSLLPTTTIPSHNKFTMPRSPRTPPSTSHSLSGVQKQQIALHYNAQIALNQPCSTKDLAEWARTTFNLTYTPSRTSIWRILNSASSSSSEQSPSSSKSRLIGKAEELDALLAAWVQEQQSRGVMINGYLIKQQTRLNSTTPAAQQLALKFSNGWLEKRSRQYTTGYH